MGLKGSKPECEFEDTKIPAKYKHSKRLSSGSRTTLQQADEVDEVSQSPVQREKKKQNISQNRDDKKVEKKIKRKSELAEPMSSPRMKTKKIKTKSIEMQHGALETKKEAKSADFEDFSLGTHFQDTSVEGAERQGKRKKKRKNRGHEEATTEHVIKSETVTEDDGEQPVKKQKKKNKIIKKENMEGEKAKVSQTIKQESGQAEEVAKNESAKKVKKRRKKSKKKNKEGEETAPDQDDLRNRRNQECTAYLNQWANDRPNWKFRKVLQINLCNHALDQNTVPDDMFEILLQYLEPCTGMNVYRIMLEKARVEIENIEHKEKVTEAEQVILSRAYKLVQLPALVQKEIKKEDKLKKGAGSRVKDLRHQIM